ncbi:hypothetical protein NW768_010717 [Fusarium equiseti]|uniref:Isochorismatase-like domain-containing protein n=1 Tax=Fusarium equiseti TaxID=61235 RepID=A0ABQ8QZB9_FUSEQ|nr:hypothetical protein NW768_010717 [Fusarium equiseti]
MAAPTSALFVVDIQNDLASNPNTRIAHAERVCHAGTDILRAVRGLPADPKPIIVFVQHEEALEDGPLVRGTQQWELFFKNNPKNTRELLVPKTQRDTFKSNPGLGALLKTEGIQHIVVFGIQSECCVLETSKGALEAGFRITLLHGAHSTYDTPNRTALEIERDVENELRALGASVVPWETAIVKWNETGDLGAI